MEKREKERYVYSTFWVLDTFDDSVKCQIIPYYKQLRIWLLSRMKKPTVRPADYTEQATTTYSTRPILILSDNADASMASTLPAEFVVSIPMTVFQSVQGSTDQVSSRQE